MPKIIFVKDSGERATYCDFDIFQALDKKDPDKLQSNKSSIDDKSVKEEDEINVTPEERSKAVEMGLRIGLIFDEDTEKKYLKMFMVCKDSYNLNINKIVL